MNELYELSYVVVDDDEDDRFLTRMTLQGANRTLPILEFADGLTYESMIGPRRTGQALSVATFSEKKVKRTKESARAVRY